MGGGPADRLSDDNEKKLIPQNVVERLLATTELYQTPVGVRHRRNMKPAEEYHYSGV